MKVINLSDLKIENLEGEHFTLVTNLECPDLDDSLVNIDKYIYNTIRKNFESYIEGNTITKPIVFEFDVNASGAKLDEYDIKSVVDIILGSFNRLLVETERRNREYRFGLTYIPDFNQIKDTQLHIMKMINYKTKFDTFNVVIKFETGDSDIYYYNLID